MKSPGLHARLAWHRLLEARAALTVVAILLTAYFVVIFFFGRGAANRDPFGSSDPSLVCHTYGEVRQCFPATEGIQRYREKRRAEGQGDH